MFLFLKTFQDPQPTTVQHSGYPSSVAPSSAIQNQIGSVSQEPAGVFPLPQTDGDVPPFADPPQQNETLSTPAPPRKDSVLVSEGSIFGPSEFEPLKNENTSELAQSPEPDFSQPENLETQESLLPPSDSEQKTETNLAINPMNQSPPENDEPISDQNTNSVEDPVAQDSLVQSDQHESTSNAPAGSNSGEESLSKPDGDLLAKSETSPSIQGDETVQEETVNQRSAPPETMNTNAAPSTTTGPSNEVVGATQSPQSDTKAVSSNENKQDFVPDGLPSTSEITAEKTAKAKPEAKNTSDFVPTETAPASALKDAQQTEIASTNPPIDPNSGSADTGSGFLNWLVPLLILLGLLAGFFIANRRRNQSRSKVQIDTSKPIRGAFKKRGSTESSTESFENFDEPIQRDPSSNQASATVSAASDDSEEFDFNDLVSEVEVEKATNTSWKHVDPIASQPAESMANDLQATDDINDDNTFDNGWRSEDENYDHALNSPIAENDNVLESSDSDFNFFADDESDADYDFNAEPTTGKDFAVSNKGKSDIDDFSDQKSPYDFGSEEEAIESLDDREQVANPIGAVSQNLDASLPEYLAEAVDPHSPWSEEKVVESVHNLIEGEIHSVTSGIAVGGISASGHSPISSNERKSKLGRFSNWFKRKSPEPEALPQVSPQSHSGSELVSDFKIAEEDLGSLFGQRKSNSSEDLNQMDAHRPSYSESDDDMEDFIDFDDEVGTVETNTDVLHDPSHRGLPANDDTSFMSHAADGHSAATDKLLSENAELHAQLSSLKSELEAFSLQQSHQLQEYQMEQQSRAHEIDEHKALNRNLQSQLAELAADRDRLRENIERLVSSQTEGQTSSAKLQEEIASTNAAKTELEIFSRQQNHQLDEYRLELQAHSKEIEKQQAMFKELKSELAEISSERNELRQQVETLRLSKQSLEEQLSAKVQKNTQQSLDFAAELQKELAATNQQRDQLQQELLDARNSRDALAQLHDELRNELEELAADKEELLSKLESAQDANSDLIEKAAELEREISELRQQNSSVNERLNEMDKQLVEAKATRNDTGPGDGTEVIGRRTKEKFTRLFKSYERERRLRKEIEQFLTEAEEQIVQLRNQNR